MSDTTKLNWGESLVKSRRWAIGDSENGDGRRCGAGFPTCWFTGLSRPVFPSAAPPFSLYPQPIPTTCRHVARTRRPTGKQETRDWKVPCTRRQESRRYDFRLPRQATWPQRPHVSASGDGPGPGRRSGGALCQTVSNRVKPLFRNLSSQFVKIRVNLLAKTFGAYSRKLSDFAVESSGFRSADFIWVGQPMSNPP